MKVVTLITSSHRNGFTKQIVDRLTIGIKDNGGSNEIIFMDDYNIKYCTGCRACEKGGGCVLDDDYNIIINKIREADYFIFTAPIFYNDIAGHSKMFLDRLGSCNYDPDLTIPETKALLMITHMSKNINKFVVENTHRCLATGNFKVNKILDIGELIIDSKIDEWVLEDYEDIGYELEEYEIIPHKLDLESATL
jgi:multimeric flavodoxin WrbA